MPSGASVSDGTTYSVKPSSDGQPVMEQGDFEEGMRAAEAIGDDTLQKETQGYVVPDSFTHGSSAQRMAALRTGYQSGDPAACRF